MKTLLLSILLLTNVNVLLSCTCNTNKDLLETLNYKKDLLVTGRVIRVDEMHALVKIDTVLNGKFQSDTIRVISGSGANCVVLFHDSYIDLSFLMNLQSFTDETGINYLISECGTSILHVRGNKLTGRISGDAYQEQEMLLSDFFELYKGKNKSKLYEIMNVATGKTMTVNGNRERIGNWQMIGHSDIITEEGEYDEKGRKTGTWTYYIAKEKNVNGLKKREQAKQKVVVYKEGRLLYVKEYYDEIGNSLDPGTVVNGDGQLFEYYDSGKLYGIFRFRNGIMEGKAEIYEEENGQLLLKGSYKNNQRHGKWTRFSSGQTRWMYEFYKMGILLYRKDGP